MNNLRLIWCDLELLEVLVFHKLIVLLEDTEHALQFLDSDK